jgi:hypothetical protein
MEGSLWAVLTGIISIAIAVMNEWFGAKARERQQQAAFDKRELEFDVLARRAYEKLKLRVVQEGQELQGIEDRLNGVGGGKK